MSVDTKELNRAIKTQIGKNCKKCKVGHYIQSHKVMCINCGYFPFEKYNK